MRHLGYNLRAFCRESLNADEPFRLARLWRDWRQVVGEEAAELARPVGRRKRTLLLGVEDPASMQEATFYAPMILESVNAFMGEVFFDKVQCDLLMGKTPLDAKPAHMQRKQLPPRPEKLGGALGLMDPDSAVGRSYRAYLAMFADEEHEADR